MGNQQSYNNLSRTTGALDSFIAELGPEVVYEKSIGAPRFLKTVKCRHRNGFLVIKVFVKRDPGLSLRNYHRKLRIERDALADIANACSHQTFYETEKAGYMIRQWVASNLYDRISTRPFLSTIEKKWIAFQLLNAMRDARNRKVFHGDIKTENVLVTSWNWVYLTDFASYKPTYLPLDDPSDFSFYFDTSGRRTCYIAPERFYTDASNPKISAKKTKLSMAEEDARKDGKLTEAMDCFSVGCVVAELFLEAPLFTLSQLYKYRDGDLGVEAQLAVIEDEGIRGMVDKMIQLDPSSRPTFDTILHTLRGSVFPECFYSYFHNYVSSINEISSGMYQGSSSAPAYPNVTSPTTPVSKHHSPSNLNPGATPDPANEPLPSDSDYRIERIWGEYETIEGFLVPDTAADEDDLGKVDYTAGSGSRKILQEIFPVELHIPNRDGRFRDASQSKSHAAKEDGPALIILALVTANVRNCALPSSKAKALDVFLALCPYLTDEAKLDRMVPYIVDLLHDEVASVRTAALRTLVQVLMLITVITSSNAAIFPEYILPNLKHLVTDPEVSVRCMYAQCIVHLADTAVRYLELWQALKAHGLFNASSDGHDHEQAHLEVSYDASLQELQNNVEDHLSTLLMDPASSVKRAVLHNISSLCIFLGRQKTNDVLLSHMITYLNDRDWLLRQAFFESIVDVAACAGGRSLEEYILPLMIQALSDVEESVVSQVLTALASLCGLGLFHKMRIWELMSATLGFLYHPNVWIRQGAAAFLVSATKPLPPSDVWCILYPSLRPYLRSDVASIEEQSLLMTMKPPLPRQILDGAVQWAMKADGASFWRMNRRGAAITESPRESVVAARKTGNLIARNKSDEDEGQITKLQQLGMTSSEESKLISMRDYIYKLANATSSFASRASQEPEPDRALKTIGNVELRKLQVVPQTIFLKQRQLDPMWTPRTYHATTLPSTRSVSEMSLKSPIQPSMKMGRVLSLDPNSGAPFEEVRRRLASINGSTSSLNMATSPREARIPIPPSAASNVVGLTMASSPSVERPSSPTDSAVSTSNSSFRPTNVLHIGSTDGQKAAPAVGSSKANATGLLDAHSMLSGEGTPDISGASSPISQPGTVRPSPRQRLSSIPISTYDGKEAGINAVIENLYLRGSREMRDDFGPQVHEGAVRRRNPVRHSYTSRDGGHRKLEATPIAHLSSHSDCITGLAVSPDHLFFVSSSDDKTVKVWDTARLERNVTSKPRHTYNQHHASVKCVCILESVHCFVSAADDGSLHVVRVHVSQSGSLPKYNKLQVIREHKLEGPGEYITCMQHYNTETSSNLVYATTHSILTVLDLRTMQVLQTMENPRQFGLITCLCVDRKRSWILLGTSSGVLSLWDRRFGLLLKSWSVGSASATRPARIHRCTVHPSKGKGKWVMVAVESANTTEYQSSVDLIEVWDIEKAILVETFVTTTPPASDVPVEKSTKAAVGADAEVNLSAAIERLVHAGEDNKGQTSSQGEKQLLSEPFPTVRALVAGLDFGGHSFAPRPEIGDGTKPTQTTRRGYMLSGSDDRKLRLWDLEKVEYSTVLSGLASDTDIPSYSSKTSDSTAVYVETCPVPANSSRLSNRPAQRMSLITHNQQTLLNSHQDVITALACIDSPFRGGLVSGDRMGVIKVWRVDVGEV